MTRKCIVPKCKSGYASNTERVSLFRVPKDDELRAKWINVIPRTKLVITTSHAVCEKHFAPSDIKRNYIHKDADGKIIANVAYQFPRLSKTAVPSIFQSTDRQTKCEIAVSTQCSAATASATGDLDVQDGCHTSHSEIRTLKAEIVESTVDDVISNHCLGANGPSHDEISPDSIVDENDCENDVPADEHEAFETIEGMDMETDEIFCGQSAEEENIGPSEVDQSQIQTADDNCFEKCLDGENTLDHAAEDISNAVDEAMDETQQTTDTEPRFEDLFNDLFDDPNAVSLPSGWFRYTSARGRKWVAFSTFDTKIEATASHPLPRKSIFLTEDGNVQTSANGKTFPFRNLCRSLDGVRTTNDLSRLLTTLSRVELCNGVNCPIVSLPQRLGLYSDVFGEWRNVNCSIISSSRICAACQRSKKSMNQRKRRLAKQQNGENSELSYRNLDEKSKSAILLKRLRSQKAVVRRARERAKKLKDEIFNAQNRICETNEESILNKCKKLNLPPTQQMCIREMIAAAGKKSSAGNRYAEDWIMSCLLMHIRSPSHYRFLLKNEILPLPSPRTIRRYMSVVNMHCGFDSDFFETFKKRLETNSADHRHGIIRVNEITLKEASVCSSSFTRKDLTNFVIEKGTTTAEANEKTTHGLVIMFKSLADEYARPIAVFASKGPVEGPELTKIVVKAIILLDNVGATVHGVVSDESPTNRRMWTDLGISGKKDNCECSFTHPCDETQKVFIMSDASRLVKNIRNRLYENRELTVDPGKSPIKWCYLKTLYDEEHKLSPEFRVCNEITENHLAINVSTKMRMRLATQILSNSVAKGLEFYHKRGVAALDGCESTIEFCQVVSDMFDVLDRRIPDEGVTPDGKDMEVLRASLGWLDEWESRLEKALITEDQFLSSDTAEALRVTLQSVIDMCNYLCEKFGFPCLLTGKINEGSLEQLFETIRQPAGSNEHPATPTFLQLYKLLSTHGLLKPPVSENCTTVHQQAL